MGVGRRTAMTDTSGFSWWSYDARGQVLSETRSITVTTVVTTPTAAAFTTLYAYDAAGRVIATTYPDGETVAQTYNARGLTFSVGQYVSATTYNALGQPVTRSYGNGTTTAYSYNAISQRLSGIASAGALTLTYAYDPVGNVRTITDTSNSGQVQTFAYDALDRLTRGYTSGGGLGAYDESYAYNAIGNLTSKGGVSYTYGDSAHKHAVTAVGGSAFTYDANGNMLTRPGQTLTWDADNRLSRVVSGTVTTTLAYGGDGERVLLAEPAGVTLFVSPGYEVFVPATSQTSTITATVYATQTYKVYFPLVMGCDYQLVGRQVRATKHIFANGQRVAMQVGCSGTPTYLYQDHLGGMAAADGGQSQRYYPYGATRSGTVSTDYQFTGQRLDSGTGLYYYGARYYDAALGRFISADTVVPGAGSPQDLNRYAYTRNNPLKYIDPTGHDLVIVGGMGATGDDPYDNPAIWEQWIRDYTGWTHDEYESQWYSPWLAASSDAEKQSIAQQTGVGVFKWDQVPGHEQGLGNAATAAKSLQGQIDDWGLADVTIVGHSKGGAVLASLASLYETGGVGRGAVKNLVMIDPPQSGVSDLILGAHSTADTQKAGIRAVFIPGWASCGASPCASTVTGAISMPYAPNHDLRGEWASYSFYVLSVSQDAHAVPSRRWAEDEE